jgi:hypothetical protein
VKPNLGYYVQKINDIVKNTEAIGEEMHPCYEEIRQAIDKEELAAISDERRAEIVTIFKEGTNQYTAMQHKKFERAYTEYVQGCEEMIASLETGIDVAAFDRAEIKQDTATDAISFSIQRMTSLLLKK